MTFSFIDIILIAIIIVFVVSGFIMGLIQGIGAIIGLAVGFWAAISYFNVLGDILTPIFLGHSIWAHIIAFILIFFLVNRLIGLLFWLIDKAFHIISIIPFLKSINRLGGAILGLIEGVLICGLMLGFLLGYFGEVPWIKDNLGISPVGQWLVIASAYAKSLMAIVIDFIGSKF